MRIGNGAANQLQLDIYGELLDSVYIYDKYGEPISYDFWTNLVRLVDWVCAHWQQPDDSIWEVRGGRRPFLYSRVLCWVAIDRGIRLAEQRSFPAPLERWRRIRDTDLPRGLPQVLEPEAARVRAVQGRQGRGRLEPAHAAGQVHQPDGPALALAPGHGRKRAGGGFAGVPIQRARGNAGWVAGTGRHLLHVLVLVCRMPRARRAT